MLILNSIDTLEMGLAYRSQLTQTNRHLNIAELDDSDVDAIQEILDESDSEDDDVVEFDENQNCAWPLKTTNE